MTPKSIGRYRDFINADYGHSFAEYLGIQAPKYDVRYTSKGDREYQMHSPRGRGQWAPTKKAAREAYKRDLAKTRPYRCREILGGVS